MGVLQTLFNQPSRTYSDPATQQKAGPPQDAKAPAGDPVASAAAAEEERMARRSQYYSAASDPRLRKEWEYLLQQDKRPRTRRPASAGPGVANGQRPPLQTLPVPRGTPKAPAAGSKDDDEKEEFFTPHTSPQASPQRAALDLASYSPVIPMQSLTLAASPETARPSRIAPSSIASSSSSINPSYASSVTSSDDNYTNYSWSAGAPASEDTHITIASSSRSSRHSKSRTDYPTNDPEKEPTADWAKDLRQLTHSEGSTSTAAPRRSHTISAPSTTTLSSLSSGSSRASSRTSSKASSRSSGRSKTEPVRPRAKRRMSEIQEEVEDDATTNRSEEDPLSNPVTGFGVIPQRRRSQSSQTRSHAKKKSLSTHSEASSTTSVRTADLPALLPHAEPTTYTSLVFPRANYQPAKHPDRITGSVDVVSTGVGSTTMSTISVTKHAAESLNRSRKFSLPNVITPRSSIESTPSHLMIDETPFVSLTSHIASPSKIQSNQVLVKVECVALEGLDVTLAREKSRTADGYGFIPGRGFCGRVLEAGYGVSNVRKGDWVMGLLEVAKSGALAEFVVLDKRRVHRTPPPTASLSAEHLAVLAVSGIASHRAVSTLPGNLKDSRVLVLQAHDGAGMLAAQELVAAGARVVVQIATEDLLETLRGLKLEAVKIGAPQAVLQALEGNDSFDAVIDTVGGKDMWETCKKLIGDAGQFTTIVGDSPHAALSRNAHVRSNMRSLKLAFKKNESVGYEWVSPSAEVDSEGKDIRDSLEAVCSLAVEGNIRPRVSPDMIVPFERAPDLLNGVHPDAPAAYLLKGGTAVVRLC
ncbi:hypothetical protein CPB86DRAFT_709243 [Serendipita vermifera]|nr:hypothetical protein CPB86DRAFT_709243 [Serendipita vermifera]